MTLTSLRCTESILNIIAAPLYRVSQPFSQANKVLFTELFLNSRDIHQGISRTGQFAVMYWMKNDSIYNVSYFYGYIRHVGRCLTAYIINRFFAVQKDVPHNLNGVSDIADRSKLIARIVHSNTTICQSLVNKARHGSLITGTSPGTVCQTKSDGLSVYTCLAVSIDYRFAAPLSFNVSAS